MDFREITELIKDFAGYIIFMIIILILALYVFGLQQVVGPSMNNTLSNGDTVILDRITYRFAKIKRGDIVALYYEDSKYLIKRIIGLPGEVVEYKDNKLYINGDEVKEPYLKGTETKDFTLDKIELEVIPEDHYFVVGDNRGNSLDSRDKRVGVIKRSNIVGKVRLRIWPINKLKVVK